MNSEAHTRLCKFWHKWDSEHVFTQRPLPYPGPAASSFYPSLLSNTNLPLIAITSTGVASQECHNKGIAQRAASSVASVPRHDALQIHRAVWCTHRSLLLPPGSTPPCARTRCPRVLTSCQPLTMVNETAKNTQAYVSVPTRALTSQGKNTRVPPLNNGA